MSLCYARWYVSASANGLVRVANLFYQHDKQHGNLKCVDKAT